MGFLKNLKAIKDQVAAGMSGQGPSEEALASLSPEQRAAYDAQLAQAAAAEQQLADAHTAARTSRPLFGPAGDYVYGLDPYEAAAAAQRILEEGGGVKAYFKAAWQAPTPGGGDRTLPEVRATYPDPYQQAAYERSQRDEARRPYLAPDGVRFPVVFTRIATTAKDELDDVVAHLASSGLAGRPELVFGAYRVPDHIGSSLTAGRRYVEWDVVHAATGPLPPTSPPAATHLDDTERWVARASGAPSVLDEDLGVAVLAAAGVGPERCTGIARSVGSVSGGGGDENSGGHGYVMIHVEGVDLLHPADARADVEAARNRLRQTGPAALPFGAPAGVHVEVLNWRTIDKAVRHGGSGVAPSVPSPFPYLPSTPQELLAAYLDIVGVNPFDTYGASVTEDQPRDIQWVRRKGVATVSTDGQSQPCVDGQSRARLGGGRLVVVTYRDRPAYVEGRQRWDAYQTDVLQARLGQGTGARRPVEAMSMGSLPSGFRRLAGAVEKVADAVDHVVGEGSGNTHFDRIAPHRYCWPPTDIR